MLLTRVDLEASGERLSDRLNELTPYGQSLRLTRTVTWNYTGAIPNAASAATTMGNKQTDDHILGEVPTIRSWHYTPSITTVSFLCRNSPSIDVSELLESIQIAPPTIHKIIMLRRLFLSGTSSLQQQCRWTTLRTFHVSIPVSFSNLDAFRDSVPRHKRMAEPVGRSWSVTELRRKSFDDLHKLWYVLYKERNMLLTEQQLSRRKGLIFPQPERIRKVQKSMGAIKHVLGERKQEALKAHRQRKQGQV